MLMCQKYWRYENKLLRRSKMQGERKDGKQPKKTVEQKNDKTYVKVVGVKPDNQSIYFKQEGVEFQVKGR